MAKGLKTISNDIDVVISLASQKGNEVNIDIAQKIGVDDFQITHPPLYGVIKIKTGAINYIPNENFTGTDFFYYRGLKRGKLEKGLIVITISETVFKPRARLLIQLGNQLIKNESIALIELVKNAYDADASICKVQMTNIDQKDFGEIIIEDDGFGMDISVIKNSWLEPGSDNKADLVNKGLVTNKFNRLPIGEKGIGRFGVHKLGKEIELISKQANSKEVVVNIDWEEFEQHKYLDEASINVYERVPQIFKGNKTGTRIIIRKLSKDWTKLMVREVYRAINAISRPSHYRIEDYQNNKAKQNRSQTDFFDAKLIIDKTEWIADIPSWKDIIEYALFFFDIEINNEEITKFNYTFSPWEIMNGLKMREVNETQMPVCKLLDITDSDEKKATPLLVPKNVHIGKVKFKGCIFIRDLPILKLASKQPNSIKNYLDENGGIRIYRNGMRIYDYGEKENDWLDLDYRRFNDPGVKISNNLMLASIDLERKESSDLIEKTNREGFIDNQAYQIFKKQILYVLKIIELLRLEDKKRIDTVYKQKKEFEPVIKSIDNLKSIIKEKVKNSKIQKEVLACVNTIEKNYKFMNDTLIKSASAGLGWSVYIHEIEKIILEIEKILKREKASDRLLKLITHLSNLIESYAQILRKTARTNEVLSKVIDQALFNVEFRLKAHNIEIAPAYKKNKNETIVSIARNLVVANVMNIIDNSIYWLDRANPIKKKILIDVVVYNENTTSIVILDNGSGFALTPNEMTEPFISAKPGGMGLGLHIVKEVMQAQGGSISFNELNEYKIPTEFKKGAAVILNFSNKKL